MTANYAPIILCAAEDAPVLAELANVVRIVTVAPADQDFLFMRFAEGAVQTEAISPAEIYRDVLAFVASSQEGGSMYTRICDFWHSHFGSAAVPPLHTITQTPGGDVSPLSLYATICGSHLLELHQRNCDLMRELGVMRHAHDALQASFERLEAFFYQNNLSKRMAALTLSVNRNQRPLTLRSGLEIEQRLPVDSGGICDVAISVRNAPKMGGGILRVCVELLESGAIVGEWEVPSGKISAGWLRLSLERSLGPDLQTPILRLTWDGEEPILLNTSLWHPDPRFMPSPDSPLLAVQVWKYVPGTRATLSSDGIVSRASRAVDRWNIGRGVLRQAVSLAREDSQIEYSDSYTGLMVRPTDQNIVAGRLDGALHAGVRHIFGGIKTEDPEGPVVEFAYGVAPSRFRSQAIRGVPVFPERMRSEWFPLPPNEWSELHLMLADTLTEDHDLFLMTRLAEGAACETPPNSCFFRVLAVAGAEAEE